MGEIDIAASGIRWFFKAATDARFLVVRTRKYAVYSIYRPAGVSRPEQVDGGSPRNLK